MQFVLPLHVLLLLVHAYDGKVTYYLDSHCTEYAEVQFILSFDNDCHKVFWTGTKSAAISECTHDNLYNGCQCTFYTDLDCRDLVPHNAAVVAKASLREAFTGLCARSPSMGIQSMRCTSADAT